MYPTLGTPSTVTSVCTEAKAPGARPTDSNSGLRDPCLQVAVEAASPSPLGPSLAAGGTLVKERSMQWVPNRQLQFVRKKPGGCELRARHTEVLEGSGCVRSRALSSGSGPGGLAVLFVAAPSLAPSPLLLWSQCCFLGPQRHCLPLHPGSLRTLTSP